MTSPPAAVRLSDVAAEAGVSLATASRVLNGGPRTVRPELAERVRAAAERLNYAVNTSAQAMVRGSLNVVGLLVHDIADPYFSSIAAGVTRVAEPAGMPVMLASTFGDVDQEVRYLTTVRGQRGRAAILAGSRYADRDKRARLAREIEAFRSNGGRVVAISQATLPADTVVIQNRAAARALATRLVDLGYRRFAILAGPEGMLTSEHRATGFREGVAAAGLPSPKVVHREFSWEGGRSGAQALVDDGIDVGCVFAVSDLMALGALAASRAHDVTVPRDVALAGFDDIVPLRDVQPALTTVRLPLQHIGELAMELVLSEPGSKARRRQVRGELQIRESTPPRR